MRFLLINTNPAVSKLINASLNRIGHEVTETGNYNNLSLDTYIAIIIDSDSYKAEYTDDLLAVSLAPSLIYLKGEENKTPENFQYILKKPFLPTDFLAFIVSILTKTPELHRFITSECRQFENIPLPQGASTNNVTSFEDEVQNKEQNDNSINDSKAVESSQSKNPAFDIKESSSEQEPTYDYGGISSDIFSNFSEELEKLYDNEDSEPIEQDTEPVFTIESNADISQPKEKISEQVDKTPQQELNANDLNFDFKDEDDLNIDTKEEDSSETKGADIDIKPQQETLTIDDENSNKISFDFDIFNESQDDTILQKTDLASEKQDETISENEQESDTDMKLDFGFGDLAKEFDDLITGEKEEADKNFSNQSTENANNTEAKIPKSEHPKYEFENLSEKDMQKALQDSGMLPPSKEIEVVKTEIGQVVEQSVKGILQSQILRDVLKGLKMNITITFEDKD
ncbi:MAG: hypothetical protein LBH45_04060 [Campylobacteraceae bacterium]|jgi:uncharacterized membrane protein|nr:hypothetical protein [Campylobacteraceae bacterium]